MIKDYPLSWPASWPRTSGYARKGNPFKVTQAQASVELEEELNRMDCKDAVLTTNQRRGENPVDPGACVYFTRNGRELSIPCDSYTHLVANIRAIGLTLVALRSIERYGTSEMMEAAFTGFAALPAGGQTSGEHPMAVLGLKQDIRYTMTDVDEAYRRLAKTAHPDTPTGSESAFRRLNTAYQQAKEALGGQ